MMQVQKNLFNYTKIGCVKIGDNVFIGAGSIILPNVTIGNNVILGAGSVISKNIPSNSVYAGNPVKFICPLHEYHAKNDDLIKTRPLYGEEYTLRKNISEEKKREMIVELEDGIGYVE